MVYVKERLLIIQVWIQILLEANIDAQAQAHQEDQRNKFFTKNGNLRG
jgi:hypothetical protein